ncbi:MAG: rhomboid family intramembrane serine protease [Janthinobacterium lividum]
MVILLPYRAKNPPEVFPYVTVALIALNTLIFALTSHDFWVVKDGAVAQFAVSHNTLSPWRLLTAMFLHGSLLHLAGNMLFLWIFGTATEGRLRPLRFLAVYLFSGALGGVLSDFVTGLIDPDIPNLGASGAIMGLAGAYLYLFPYAPIRLVWGYWIWLLPRGGITEWQARWVILYFVGLDIFNGLIMGTRDGVGHLAHLGGAGAGFLLVWLMRVPRDTEDISEVQATLSDMRDVALLPLHDLEALMQRPTTDVRLILAYCRQATISTVGASEAKCLWALHQYGTLLIDQADPVQLAGVLLPLSPASAGQVSPVFFLRLGSRLERGGAYEPAVRIYHRMCEVFPPGPDIEMAYLRVGRLMENFYHDTAQARFCYTQMLTLFPYGAMAAEAERGLQKLGSLPTNIS